MATIGQGTVIKWRTTTVGKGTVARGPSTKTNTKESTNFDSGGYEEYSADVKSGGTIHVECQIQDTTDAGQWAVINDDGTSGAWEITYATGYKFSGNGYLSYEPSTGARDFEMLAFDIQVTGAVTKSSPT